MMSPTVSEIARPLEPVGLDPFGDFRAVAPPAPWAVRELDSRVTYGLHVRLLWDPAQDRLFVAVVDLRRGDAFQLDVPPGAGPDAFQHPYAYAALPAPRSSSSAASTGVPLPR